MKGVLKHLIFSFAVLTSCSIFSNAQIIVTVAGNGLRGDRGDGGPAVSASLLLLHTEIAFDKRGNMYIPQYTYIRKVDSSDIISSFAGVGSPGRSGDGGLATSAYFMWADCLAFDKAGNLYIGDYSRIRKIDTFGMISTIAGDTIRGLSGDGGPATAALLGQPTSIVVDSNGNIFFSDGIYNVLRKINNSGVISLYAGTGIAGYSGDGGLATAAQFSDFSALAADRAGNIYVGDGSNYRIRRIDAATNIVTTIGGNGIAGYTGDGGPAISAKLDFPMALAFDAAGNLFAATGVRIRKIDPSNIISTAAGNGAIPCSGDGGNPLLAGMSPGWLVFDSCGNLFIADNDLNNRIREIIYDPSLPVISITGPASAGAGTSVILNATVTGTGSYRIKWIKNGVVFSITSSPTTSYVKGVGNDTITAAITNFSGQGCFNVSSSQTIFIADPSLQFTLTQKHKPNIYPNPIGNNLVIDDFVGTNIKYQILNMTGASMIAGTLLTDKTSIDTRTLEPGVYILQLVDDDGERSLVRLVKQ
jgi:hypothetical protein